MAIFDHDFFDELTDKLALTGKIIGEKAKEVTDSAKTSLQIAQEEKKLRTAYRQLGMYVFEKSGMQADEAMKPYFAAISEAKANIESLKASDRKTEKEAEPEEADECDEPDDDSDDEPEDSQAGAESGGQAEQEPAERVCPVCKSVVSSQLIYCPKCGEKLK